jgi:hypothetical protein
MMEATVTSGDDKRRRRARGLLRAAPGLITPAVLLVACIRWFVHAVEAYNALPLAPRTADGDPFSANADIFVAGMGIVCVLVLFAPPLLAGLPGRLRVWHALVAVALQVLPLYIAFAAGTESLLGWLAFCGLAYVPALALVRLVTQRRAAAPHGPMSESRP